MKTRVTCSLDSDIQRRIKALQRVYTINVSQVLADALLAHIAKLERITLDGFGERGLKDIYRK